MHSASAGYLLEIHPSVQKPWSDFGVVDCIPAFFPSTSKFFI